MTHILQVDLLEFRRLTADLYAEHYREVCVHQDVLALAPDWAAYERMQQADRVVFLVAVRDGIALGYSVFFVAPHMHYRDTVVAMNDVLYVSPEHRRGRTGALLIRETENAARERGAKILSWHAKPNRGGLDEVLAKLDRYRHDETIYSTRL